MHPTNLFIEDITPITAEMPMDQAVSLYLNHMGFPEMYDVRPGECYTLKQHLENCPTCRKGHQVGSSYLVETLVNECYTVRNEEEHCHSRIIDIKDMVEQHAGLSRILENPTGDTPLADLYVKEHGQNLTALDDRVFRFVDNRWGIFETPDLENDVLSFLDRILRGLIALLHHEEGMRQQSDIHVNVKKLQEFRGNFVKAMKFGESSNKRKQILATIRTRLHNTALRGKWDSSPLLLGTNNGVVMLDTLTFRPARKEDYVTMTCGYDWVETVEPSIEAELEDFLAQIYPVPAEREFMQRYCGYCLTGRHDQKLFLMLTDKRGGFNGKSTFLSLLRGCMGDYAIKADASVLYKQDRARGINDHAGGLFAYEKKRLMVVEETDSSKVG